MIQTASNNDLDDVSAELFEHVVKRFVTKSTAEQAAMKDQVTRLQHELEALRTTSAALTGQVEQSRKKISELEIENELYRRNVLALLPPPGPFTEEELNEIRRNPVTFEQIHQDIEEIRRS